MNKLVHAGQIVNSLSCDLRYGSRSVVRIPEFVTQVINDELWRDRIDEMTRRHEHFDSFEEFVTTHPTRGLGATVAMLRNLCRDVPAATEAIERVLARPVGTNQHSEGVDNIHGLEPRPTGTSRAAGIRKLQRHVEDPAVAGCYGASPSMGNPRF